MSIRPWYDVWCDEMVEDGGDSWRICGNWTEGGATRREARTRAEAHGWEFRGSRCYCPGHRSRPAPPAAQEGER